MSATSNIISGGRLLFCFTLLVCIIVNLQNFIIVHRRALVLYVAAGALQEALAALRGAQQPETAAMFILACREIHAEFVSSLDSDEESGEPNKETLLNLPELNPDNEDVIAVGEYYGEYQRKLVHLCMDSQPIFD